MWMGPWDCNYGLFVRDYQIEEIKYPEVFSSENLRDQGVRNDLYYDILEKLERDYREMISLQEAQDLLTKVSSGTGTGDEIIRLLDYIFRKQFSQKDNNLFGDLIVHDPDEIADAYSGEGCKDEASQEEILNWIEMEEEGKPFEDSYRIDWDDIEASCLPSEKSYRIKCNEIQLKNRIKIAFFLDEVLWSPYLSLPLTDQELEEHKKAAKDLPFDEEMPF